MFFQNAQCIFGPKAQELVQSSGKRGQELAKSSVRWMLKKAGANGKSKERGSFEQYVYKYMHTYTHTHNYIHVELQQVLKRSTKQYNQVHWGTVTGNTIPRE